VNVKEQYQRLVAAQALLPVWAMAV